MQDCTVTPPTLPQQQARKPGEARRVLEALLGVPFTEGNSVEVLRNGDEAFSAWLEEIGGARRSVDLLSYLWGTGPITDTLAGALADRARAGVRVRVMLDALGSKGIDGSQVERMRSAGAQVEFFRPVPTWRITAVNARSHRRALIIDERVAFTGGMGVDRAWTGGGRTRGDWRDTGVRVRGPAVDGVRGAFAASWIQAPQALIGDQDLFPSPEPAGAAAVQVLRPASQPGWNDAVVALVALLHLARERVRIATPYARLPVRLLEAVTAAARRGVRVQILVPGPHVDHAFAQLQGQHEHQALLQAGVEIWEYQPSMLHVKLVAVDGHLAMVGSVNVDARSLVLNEQVVLLIDDPSTTAALERDFDDDLSHSRQTTVEKWSRRGRRRRVMESVAYAVGRPVRGMGATGMTTPGPPRGPGPRKKS